MELGDWTPDTSSPPDRPPHGVLVVDKPGGVTSHDVIDDIRGRWQIRKAGHLGTLDPAATGVLPVTIGKATRLAQFIPREPKEYLGTIQLGWETTTGDAEGEPIGRPATVDVSRHRIAEAMASLEGWIEQTPPAYSAKKVAGVRAHRLARQGKRVDLSAVRVEIREFVLVSAESERIRFRVVCSAGTYIRSLARDLGILLSCGAHLNTLRRTRSGPFEIGAAVTLDEARPEDVIPAELLLEHLRRVDVDSETESLVRHGRAIVCEASTSPARIFNKKGELIAIATVENGWARPRVVLV